MPYWMEENIKNRNSPLLKGMVRELLSEEQLHAKLAEGEDAVALSIKKWEGIYTVMNMISKKPIPQHYFRSLSKHIGYKTCALCITSIAAYKKEFGDIKTGSDKCRKCPLAEIDRCIDHESTFSKIERILLFREIVPDDLRIREVMDSLMNLAQVLIKNLEGLANRGRTPSPESP